jgi:thiol-disulfide isomerase/thioredoxin
MKPWISAIILFSSAALLFAADGDRTVVELHLNRNVSSFVGQAIDFGAPRDARVIAEPGTVRQGRVGGLAVTATPRADNPGRYLVHLKSGKGNPVSVEVSPDAPVRVEIERLGHVLPYKLGLDPKAGPNGSPREVMTWQALYRAEGKLTIGECGATLVIWDMNADGVFDRGDFRGGTAAGIDLNGDGQISGKGEFLQGGEVFEFCGRRLYVDPDSLEPDGSAVTKVETPLERPRVGAPVPTLVMETTDGATLRSVDWKGKVTLLDFWASWCGYCIEGFPTIKQLQDEFAPRLQVISIDTDEPPAIPAARRVIASHDMPWSKVMSGKGMSDPLWMMFQGLDHTMPLYVMIDREGIVRYSGAGGEKLTELRAAVETYAGKP